MANIAPFPWQIEQWQQLIARAMNATLPHAMLIHGAMGTGKKLFVAQFAKTLLCSQGLNKKTCCNQCYSCLLIEAESHPDFLKLEPEEIGKNIRVDQIRILIEKLNQTSQYNGYKIAIINPADALNITAANALLKTLEEPVAKTLIILVTDKPQQILPTILSRCQKFLMTPPQHEMALAWLKQQGVTNAELICQLCENSPLRALAINEDMLAIRNRMFEDLLAISQGNTSPIVIAAEWAKHSIDKTLEFLFLVFVDLIRLKHSHATKLYNHDKQLLLQQFARIKSNQIFLMLEQLYKFKAQLNVTNLNLQLVIESILCSWYENSKQ